ncbi:glycoside hydrolase family 97 catalytic domain-containing protein [Tamlana fucoidanivorans]|nr:glycoside hydrolase family 97 protein [Tamlana fucoidanivorans]
MKSIKIIILVLCMYSCSIKKQEVTVKSPKGHIEAKFQLLNGKPTVALFKNNVQILMPSSLGLKLKEVQETIFSIDSVVSKASNTTWEPVWDKHSKIVDDYKETTYWLKGGNGFVLGVVLRIYNDALAIRYEIPEQEGFKTFTIAEDLTSFVFTQDHTFWSANGERHNLGPLPLSEYPKKTKYTPTVLQLENNSYASILEAAIYNFANFNLAKGNEDFSLKCVMNASVGSTPAKTSWRVVLLGDKPGDLVESNTLVNLNPPCAIEDPSWIKPGKAVWDWRVWGYKTKDGYTYDLDTKSHKRLIDFAAENNIKYLLMDADWYGPEFSPDADPTSANSKINIEENMAYAKNKGVGIILYLNDVGAKKFGLERILKQFSDWGASGIKYGFMTTKEQKKVIYTRKVVELCAKYKLTVNFHDGPLPPSGDRRTWPNLVTREYGHSQADAKRSYYPETVVNQVFINMITGPLDMCNGWFGFEEAESRVRVFEKIPGTVAAEVAKLAVLFSGIHVIPDSPEEYNKKSDLFEFVKTLPDSFDELKIINGTIDEFVTVGRRKGDDWYIGSLTNRDSRVISIDLSFLKEGETYKATLFEDAPNSHFLNNQETYIITRKTVAKGDVLNVKLAPGGGHAIRLIKE